MGSRVTAECNLPSNVNSTTYTVILLAGEITITWLEEKLSYSAQTASLQQTVSLMLTAIHHHTYSDTRMCTLEYTIDSRQQGYGRL